MKWIFEGRVYSSLEELSGKTFSKDNRPEPVFTEKEVFKKEEDAFCSARFRLWNQVTIDYCESVRYEYKTFSDYKNKNKVDVGEGAESESEL